MACSGLEGGPKDVQVFELFLTEKWRQKYDKVRAAGRHKQAPASAETLHKLIAPPGISCLSLLAVSFWPACSWRQSYGRLYQNRTDTPFNNQRLGEFRRNAFTSRQFRVSPSSAACHHHRLTPGRR